MNSAMGIEVNHPTDYQNARSFFSDPLILCSVAEDCHIAIAIVFHPNSDYSSVSSSVSSTLI